VSVIRRRATHNGLHAFFCKKEKNIIFVLKNQNNMQVITAKELRANQKKYFDLAENETIFESVQLITSRTLLCYCSVVITSLPI
jgi:hypothetical protein